MRVISFKAKIALWITVSLVIIVGISVSVGVTLGLKKNEKTTEKSEFTEKPFDFNKLSEEEKGRIDCFLDAQSKFENLTEYACKKRNCIYDPNVSHSKVPKCYFNRTYLGYKMSQEIENSYILDRSGAEPPFMGVIEKLKLDVEFSGTNMIRIKIYDPSHPRYEVPLEDLNWHANANDKEKSSAKFEIAIDENDLFNFKIIRKSDEKSIFDTSFGGLVFSKQFLQIATKLLTTNIFGFGENNHETLKHNLNFMSWGMFTRDNAPGWGDNKNMYGQHPFYMGIEENGKAHGVFLLNSNAMEYLFTPSPSLVLRSIGGIFDLYFIIEESPMAVTQAYHKLIGLPFFPPYWSFGFQLSRWGYKDLNDMKEVITRTKKANIPHDVQYADIDYMLGCRDFTTDPILFNGTFDYFESQKKNGMKFVLIIDPGLVIERNYTPFTSGLDKDVFIRWPENFEPIDFDLDSNYVISWVWPNQKLVYPDFMRNATHNWWEKTIEAFRTNRTHGAPIDGIWIDMNEPSSFDTNELKPFNWLNPLNDERYPLFTLKCPPNRLDDPPYRTKNTFMFDDDSLLAKKARLSQKTICMISKQGNDNQSYYHYDVHSLYAHAQSKSTSKALTNLNNGKRAFVLTRSSFAGTGKFAAKWTGDIDSSWKHLKMSLIGVFELSLFGFPMVGADICGFWGDTEIELCQRWQQLGAFYPFSRNHNSAGAINQDPAALGDQSLINSTVETLNIRYTILPYLYTLFYNSHINGGPVARPLLFEFPMDDKTFDSDEQMLIGPAFMVTPVLYKGHTKVNAYIPDARWFDFRTGNEVEKSKRNTIISLSAPKDYIPLHIRGGYIIPTQDPKGSLNTVDSREKPFGLLVALDDHDKAIGDLFIDDGDSPVSLNKFAHIEFSFETDVLKIVIAQNNQILDKKIFDIIKIFGSKKYSKATLNDNIEYPIESKVSNMIILTFSTGVPLNQNNTIRFDV